MLLGKAGIDNGLLANGIEGNTGGADRGVGTGGKSGTREMEVVGSCGDTGWRLALTVTDGAAAASAARLLGEVVALMV